METGRLRWTSPPLLNDPFDLSFDLLLDVDPDRVTAMALDLLWDDYLKGDRAPPSAGFAQWKALMAAAGQTFDRSGFDAALSADIRRLAAQTEAVERMNVGLRAYLSRAKLICLSEDPASILMWSHYAQQHQGAVLRLTREGEDNPFGEARPVVYLDDMPRLADEAGLARMISGRPDDAKVVTDRQIYTKARVWAYEKEWRIDFGFGRRIDQAVEDLPFDPALLTGLILGCRTPLADRTALVALARALNPDVEIFVTEPAARTFSIEIRPASATDF